jgi:hypothetical protein
MALGADSEKGGVMAFDSFKITKYPQDFRDRASQNAAYWNRYYGDQAATPAFTSLLEMLKGKGRVDPRLLAMAQAQNARSTQQQQDAARSGAARSGLGGGGLNQALQAAIGASGANRSANLNYQDIADSYTRQQENLGLYNQLVVQPSLGFGSLGVQFGLGQQEQKNKQKAGVLGFAGGLFGAAGKAFGA